MAKDDPTNDEESEEIPEIDTSLRDGLEAAFSEEEEEAGDETESQTEEETTDEENEGEKDGEKTDEKDDTGKIGDGEGRKEPSGINAPIGFTPESREVWKDVPDVVKEQIHKREQEITEAMSNTGEYRRTHTALNELAQSYAPILAAEGAETPMAAIEGLFRTVAELRVGSPQQIATKMAQLIGHYGVDISMLDQALSGEPVQTDEMTAMERMLDNRLAPLQDMLNQQSNDRTVNDAASRDAVNTELQEFSKTAEFLQDVRMDMADLIDLASKQGRKMDFKEAYDKACALNPSVSKVIEDRKQAEILKNSGEVVDNKRNASSSIASSSGGAGAQGKPNTLRGEIEANWDAATE